jgi:hypothetical protein
MAHGVADGGNHHLRHQHDTHSSASLKEQPILDARGTGIQANKGSQFLKDFMNRHLPWMNNHAMMLDNDIRQFKEQDTFKVFSSVFTQQGPIMASHSSSTPVDHGHKLSSYTSYQHASANNDFDESSNIHSSSTPVDHGRTMDMGKNHHTPTSQHLPTTTVKNLPISTLPPRLWTMDMGKNHHTPTS